MSRGISAGSLQFKKRGVGGAQPPPPLTNLSKQSFSFSSLYPLIRHAFAFIIILLFLLLTHLERFRVAFSFMSDGRSIRAGSLVRGAQRPCPQNVWFIAFRRLFPSDCSPDLGLALLPLPHGQQSHLRSPCDGPRCLPSPLPRSCAASLLFLPLAATANVDGEASLLSDLLADSAEPPPISSRHKSP